MRRQREEDRVKKLLELKFQQIDNSSQDSQDSNSGSSLPPFFARARLR